MLYRLGVASGHYERSIRVPESIPGLSIEPIFPKPSKEQLRNCLGDIGAKKLIIEADEIVSGNFRIFGGIPVPLNLTPDGDLPHWTKFEKGEKSIHGKTLPAWQKNDIKFTWEPARFGWAYILGRAYILTGDEKYAAVFWERCEEFADSNTPYIGPNWSSGQEAGLRLMALAWCAQIFAGSENIRKNPGKIDWLANLAAAHAGRIPGTLIYARSQNNNHLLTEAAALFTAGHCLPNHPMAESWKKNGTKWLAWCFENQIDDQGEYVQHSANYHRLMLQTALWVFSVAGKDGFPGGVSSLQSLAKAARWLLNRLDPVTGQVPNLGANDGALIMPFSSSEFTDHRPAARAAARAFLDEDLAGSDGEEMSLWYGQESCKRFCKQNDQGAGIIRGGQSWATLRAVHYHSRPSHADHLHLDLWCRGENIALDAGTFSYNGQPPWDNPLTSTLVHNTITINGQEQMTRTGRFLYTDWEDSTFLPVENKDPSTNDSCTAQTSAYQRFGVIHKRKVQVFNNDRWLVTDHLSRNYPRNIGSSKAQQAVTCRLQWLLPDLQWNLDTLSDGYVLTLVAEIGVIKLNIRADHKIKCIGLVRAGELVHGQALYFPYSGWYSPTYNLKIPALSLSVEIETSKNNKLESEFFLPVIK